jgi:hypothetical protein
MGTSRTPEILSDGSVSETAVWQAAGFRLVEDADATSSIEQAVTQGIRAIPIRAAPQTQDEIQCAVSICMTVCSRRDAG